MTRVEHKLLALSAGLILSTAVPAWFAAAPAAEIGPPMFDIARQCDAATHGSAAMSECVVAESEARAELLTNWSRYGDAEAGKCVKAARKVRRSPYAGMLKCLAPAPVTVQAPAQKATGSATIAR